jgi:hypothetical protein
LHIHTYKHVSTIIPMKVILQHHHNTENNYIHIYYCYSKLSTYKNTTGSERHKTEKPPSNPCMTKDNYFTTQFTHHTTPKIYIETRYK